MLKISTNQILEDDRSASGRLRRFAKSEVLSGLSHSETKYRPSLADRAWHTCTHMIHARILHSAISCARTRCALSRGSRSPARSLAHREWIRDFSRSRRRSVPTVRSGARHEREPRQSRLRSIDRLASAESPKCPPPRWSRKPPRRGAHTCLAQNRGRTRFRYPPIGRSIESRSSASPRSTLPRILRKKGRTSIEAGEV